MDREVDDPEGIQPVRAMRPTERAAVGRLGERLFAPFGEYGTAMSRWLRDPGVTTLVTPGPRGILVAFAMIAPIDDDKTGRRDAYLLGIGVDARWRRCGVGRGLLDAAVNDAIRRAPRWGTERLRLDVAEDNDAAITFFREAGFAEIDGVSRPYGGGQVSVTMARSLL